MILTAFWPILGDFRLFLGHFEGVLSKSIRLANPSVSRPPAGWQEKPRTLTKNPSDSALTRVDTDCGLENVFHKISPVPCNYL